MKAFNEIVTMAMDMNKEQETISSFFLQKNNGLMVVAMPIGKTMDEKEVGVTALRELITRENITRYWMIAPSFATNKDEVERRLQEELTKHILCENPDKESVKEFLKIAMQLNNSPSTNPCRQEIIMVCQFDKQEGTELVTINYVRNQQGVAKYESPEYHDATGSMVSIWNVWNQIQVTLEEEEVKNGL